MLNIENKDDQMVKFENLLIEFLQNQNSLSPKQINILTHWCIHNFEHIDNANQIIDKLYQMHPNHWALSAALETGNEHLTLKFWDKLQNYAYDELIECASYSANTNLYKLVYDHIDDSCLFTNNKDTFYMYGLLGAIQTNTIESEIFMKNRYPQINTHYNLCYTKWFNKYVAALILNLASISKSTNYHDHVINIICWYKISPSDCIDVLETVFHIFGQIYNYNTKTINSKFFDILDLFIEKFNINIDEYVSICYNKQIMDHFIRKQPLDHFFKNINTKSRDTFFDVYYKYDRKKVYDLLHTCNIKIDFNHLMKLAAKKRDVKLITLLLENDPIDHCLDYLIFCTALEKTNNMAVISILSQTIDLSTIKINKLLKSACQSGKWANVKYLIDRFEIKTFQKPNKLLWRCFIKTTPDLELINYLIDIGANDFLGAMDDSIFPRTKISFEIFKLFINQNPKYFEPRCIKIYDVSKNVTTKIQPLLKKNDVVLDLDRILSQQIYNFDQDQIWEVLHIISNRFDACLNNLDSVLSHLISANYQTAIDIMLEKYSQYIHHIDQIIYDSCDNLKILQTIYYYPNHKFKIYDESFDKLMLSEDKELIKQYIIENAKTKIETNDDRDKWRGWF